MRNGADVNVQSSVRTSTPLHCACLRGKLEGVKLLVDKGADVRAKNVSRETPSDLTRSYDETGPQIRELLFRVFISTNNDVDGDTLLHRACSDGLLETVKELLNSGAYVHADDNDGATPLHKACYNGHLEIIKWLLENGADINVQSDGEGQSPLHIACLGGQLEVAKLLVEKGANLRPKNNDGKALTVCPSRWDPSYPLLLHPSSLTHYCLMKTKTISLCMMQSCMETWRVSKMCFTRGTPMKPIRPLLIQKANTRSQNLGDLLGATRDNGWRRSISSLCMPHVSGG